MPHLGYCHQLSLIYIGINFISIIKSKIAKFFRDDLTLMSNLKSLGNGSVKLFVQLFKQSNEGVNIWVQHKVDSQVENTRDGSALSHIQPVLI